MRNKLTCLCIWSLGLAFVMTLLTLPARAGSAPEKLVAPIYPGAIRLGPGNDDRGQPFSVTFAVRDPHDQVQAFYVPKYARLPQKDEGKLSGSNMLPLIVHSYQQALKIIQAAHGDYTLADATEVFLQWRSPDSAGGTETKVFMELDYQAKRFPAHVQELGSLKKQYEWLKHAYYRDHKDLEIYQRCNDQSVGKDETTSDPDKMDKIQEEMNRLAEAGRYQEASELWKKSMSGSTEKMNKAAKADNFGLWRKCLEEMASYGYLTRVSIALDPSLWRDP